MLPPLPTGCRSEDLEEEEEYLQKKNTVQSTTFFQLTKLEGGR
jgi:hypothetical protein